MKTIKHQEKTNKEKTPKTTVKPRKHHAKTTQGVAPRPADFAADATPSETTQIWMNNQQMKKKQHQEASYHQYYNVTL